MISTDLRRILIYLVLLVVIQVPLLQNWVLFGTAFPFPYIGFILLFPHRVMRSWHMIIAFLVGLLVDVFSNTPGMHAASSVAIAYSRNFWLSLATDVSDEDLDISIQHLKIFRFLFFVMPLVFFHHILLFLLENEGFTGFLRVLSKAFWSSIISSSIIVLAAIIAVRRKQRI